VQFAIDNSRRPVSDRTIFLALVVASACLFATTESTRYVDATTYAGEVRSHKLIEPGHLLWRPLVFIAATLSGQLGSYSGTLWVTQWLCLIASACAVGTAYLLGTRLFTRRTAFVCAALLAVTNGFWGYSFSGSCYDVCVLFVMLGVRAAVGPDDRPRGMHALRAGLLGGLAASTWGMGVIAAPGIWLSVLLAGSPADRELRPAVRNTFALGSGYILTFVAPLVASFLGRGWLATAGIGEAGIRKAGAPAGRFLSWFASSSHGIPVHFSVAQILRAALGWAQSLASTGDLGTELRLWLFGERSFPFSPWLAVLALTYVAIGLFLVRIVRGFHALDSRHRGVAIAAIVALMINLAVGVAWQGTDLERYLPSLPFQLALLGIALESARPVLAGRHRTDPALWLFVGLAAINWLGDFAPALSPSSTRQVWLRAIRQNAAAHDLVIVLGPRPPELISPHDSTLAHVHYVSLAIVTSGDGWRDITTWAIARTRERGGRVLIADALVSGDPHTHSGWSFIEHPRPSAQDLASYFRPLTSDRVGFIAGDEKIWLGH